MSIEEFILDLLVSEEELMELDRVIHPIWKEGGMSCEVEVCEGTFHSSDKECRIHWREYHQEYVSLYRCPVAGCLCSSARRGQVTRHRNFRHQGAVDPCPVLVANPKFDHQETS